MQGAPHSDSQRVVFADVHRPLTLFAQGLAGKYLHLLPAEPRDQRNRAERVPHELSIYLPAEIAHFAAAELNLSAYRIEVLFKISYFIEGTYSVDLQSFFGSVKSPELLQRVFFLIEDSRIHARMRWRYPGARAALERVLRHARSLPPLQATPATLSGVIEALRQYCLGAARDTLLADAPPALLRQVLDAAAAAHVAGTSVRNSAQIALRIYALLEQFAAPTAERQSTAELEALAAPHSTDEPAVAMNRGAEGFDDGVGFEIGASNRRSGGSQGASSGAPAEAVAAPIRTGTNASVCAGTGSGAGAGAGARSFIYDEWDYQRQIYLSGWCRLFEHRLRGVDTGFIEGVRRRHASLARQVRRQFGFIKPQTRHRTRRTSDGDELELDAVIDAVIDRRTRHASDAHLYIRRDRALRDVAAAFLVDMSASTDFALPEPATPVLNTGAETIGPGASGPDRGLYVYGGYDELPEVDAAPKRRVIDVSKDALALMCDALQALGDRYAIYGFSGDGRDNVEFHVAKEFTESLSARTWGALAAMQPRRSTRMGTAIRHALRKLAREPAKTKVLIVISDGYPEDHDYGPDRTDREYGIQDTARALMEVQQAGVVDFCVTIDPAGHDYLRRMCNRSRYLVIDDVTSLPRELSKLYQALTMH